MPRQAKPKPTPDPTPDDTQAGTPEPTDEEPTPEAYAARRIELISRLDAEIKENGMPKSLPGKLAMITGLVDQVKKSGENTFHHYRYAKESDLVEAIRPMLARLRIWVWWSLFADPEKGIVAHERRSQTIKDRDRNVTGEQESLTVVTAQFKFIDDLGTETEPQIMMGYGDDNSDKGLYKALTGMEKYFLFKTFLVSTGDDPEGDPRADQRAAARGSSPRVDVQRSGRQGPSDQPRAGGRQQTPSSTQTQVLRELLKTTGRKKSEDVLKYLGVAVEDGDPATTLMTTIRDMKPEDLGKHIAALRAEVQAANPEAEAAKAEQPAGAAGGAPDGAAQASDGKGEAGWEDANKPPAEGAAAKAEPAAQAAAEEEEEDAGGID